ncbi:MAG: hypothetical protein ABI386_08980 [Rhodanobacter sp.]
MPNPLKVNLTTTTPIHVDIDQNNGANHVGRNPKHQTISWQLEGHAATGSFVDFYFLPDQTPDPGTIFGEPDYGSNHKSLSITDLNTSSSTSGSWIYFLEIDVGGQKYSTTSSIHSVVSNNPTIKNL